MTRLKLLERLIRYTLDNHEWCMEPTRTAKCGHQESACTNKKPCEGCLMRKEAVRAIKYPEIP